MGLPSPLKRTVPCWLTTTQRSALPEPERTLGVLPLPFPGISLCSCRSRMEGRGQRAELRTPIPIPSTGDMCTTWLSNVCVPASLQEFRVLPQGVCHQDNWSQPANYWGYKCTRSVDAWASLFLGLHQWVNGDLEHAVVPLLSLPFHQVPLSLPLGSHS